MLALTVVALSMVPSTLFASAPDTVIVYANPPTGSGAANTMDQQIMGDTLAGGVLPANTVFVLQQTGSIDTVYYISATVQFKGNLVLVGKVNPKTGHPPVIAPAIAADNSSPYTYFNPMGGDTLRVEGVYIMGTRSDYSSVTGIAFGAGGDSVTFIINHDVIENIGGSGTPNIINTWGQQHINIYCTNCDFRNNQDDVPQNPGIGWVDPGNYPCDTAEFINNTFFIFGGTTLGSAGYIGYFDFEHNTVLFTTKGGIETLEQLWNAKIKNNIFFSMNSTGLDTGHVYDKTTWNANFYGPPAIIELDTLSTLKSAPFNISESMRNIQVTNNAYFWPKGIVDNWTALNNRTVTTGYGQIVSTVWLAQTGGDFVNDKTTWPLINVSNNDSTDPGFNATMVQQASDSMAMFVDTCWVQGSGANDRPYWNRQTDPPTWSLVPSGWSWATGGYPVPENLKYSNTSLQSAGSDGFALGDLNWFPAQLALWQAGKVNAVEPTGLQIPSKFDLSQNYPNPFNPSTTIKVSLTHSGAMSLTVYNVLGQVVQVVDQGNKPAGEYTYNISMDRFASGIYFFTLRQGTNSITKKMVLLK
jgi:hypothetical protein